MRPYNPETSTKSPEAREKHREYMKAYNERTKAKRMEQGKERIKCSNCGFTVRKYNYSKHQRSNACQNQDQVTLRVSAKSKAIHRKEGRESLVFSVKNDDMGKVKGILQTFDLKDILELAEKMKQAEAEAHAKAEARAEANAKAEAEAEVTTEPQPQKE